MKQKVLNLAKQLENNSKLDIIKQLDDAIIILKDLKLANISFDDDGFACLVAIKLS